MLKRNFIKNLHLFFLQLAFFLFVNIHSQVTQKPIEKFVSYEKFTRKDGLPINKTTTLFEDSKGFIWVGTYNGISRYDGRFFYNFDENKNRTESAVENILEIGDYRMAILHTNATIDIYDKNILIKKIKHSSIKYYHSWLYQLNKNYFIVQFVSAPPKKENFIEIYDSKSLKKIKTIYFPYDSFIYSSKDNNLLIVDYNTKIKKYKLFYYKFNGNNFQLLESQLMPDMKSLAFAGSSCIISKDGKKQYLFYIENGKIATKYRNVDFVDYDFGKKRIDITYYERGWFRRNEQNQIIFTDNKLQSYNLGDISMLNNKVLFDKRGSIWITSENALYKYADVAVENVKLNLTPNGNEQIWSVAKYQNYLYFSSYTDGLYKVSNELKTKEKLKVSCNSKNLTIATMASMSTSYGGLVVPFAQHFIYFFDNKKYCFELDPSSDVFSTIEDSKNHIIYFSDYINIYRFDEKTKRLTKIIQFPKFGLQEILDISFDKDGNLLAICRFGLLVLKKEQWITYKAKEYVGGSICKDDFGSNWIGGYNGLLELLPNKTTKKINFKFKISFISDLYVYQKKWLLIQTFNEIILLDLEEYHKKNNLVFYRYDLQKYFSTESSGQNSMFEDIDGSLWIATGTEVLHFNPKNLVKSQKIPAPSIFATKYHDSDEDKFINDRVSNEVIQIDKKFRELTFQFASPIFYNQDIAKYRVRLNGFTTNWETIEKINEVTFRNLKPGVYTFEAQVTVDGVHWSPSSFGKPIEIDSYFYETIWFKLLVLSVLLFLFFLVIRNFFKEKQKKLKSKNKLLTLQQDISKMELQNLNQRLDPHEIKNLLSSISPEIQKNAPEAYKRMVKIFNLTKASLNNDSYTESIKNQLKQIEDLLSLEKTILKEPLEYSIENKVNNLEFQIPRLMLKNLVENAIKHGIKGINRQGKINVKLVETDDFVELTIEDNGKGIQNNKNDTGIGISTYMKLFKTLNKINQHKASLSLKNNEHGTIVEVIIPKNYLYD